MSRVERVEHPEGLDAALTRLGVVTDRPVLAVVGGAASFTGDAARLVGPLLDDAVLPVCEELATVVLDGGTDSGLMGLIGRAYGRRRATFPLIGITAAGTIEGEAATVDDPSPLEPHHSGHLLVPGTRWGDESPWIARVASVVSAGRSIVGLLAGGGTISIRDVGHLLDAGGHVVALAGTGRLADAVAAPEDSGDAVVDTFRRSGRIIPVDVTASSTSLADALRGALRGAT